MQLVRACLKHFLKHVPNRHAAWGHHTASSLVRLRMLNPA